MNPSETDQSPTLSGKPKFAAKFRMRDELLFGESEIAGENMDVPTHSLLKTHPHPKRPLSAAATSKITFGDSSKSTTAAKSSSAATSRGQKPSFSETRRPVFITGPQHKTKSSVTTGGAISSEIYERAPSPPHSRVSLPKRTTTRVGLPPPPPSPIYNKRSVQDQTAHDRAPSPSLYKETLQGHPSALEDVQSPSQYQGPIHGPLAPHERAVTPSDHTKSGLQQKAHPGRATGHRKISLLKQAAVEFDGLLKRAVSGINNLVFSKPQEKVEPAAIPRLPLVERQSPLDKYILKAGDSIVDSLISAGETMLGAANAAFPNKKKPSPPKIKYQETVSGGAGSPSQNGNAVFRNFTLLPRAPGALHKELDAGAYHPKIYIIPSEDPVPIYSPIEELRRPDTPLIKNIMLPLPPASGIDLVNYDDMNETLNKTEKRMHYLRALTLENPSSMPAKPTLSDASVETGPSYKASSAAVIRRYLESLDIPCETVNQQADMLIDGDGLLELAPAEEIANTTHNCMKCLRKPVCVKDAIHLTSSSTSEVDEGPSLKSRTAVQVSSAGSSSEVSFIESGKSKDFLSGTEHSAISNKFRSKVRAQNNTTSSYSTYTEKLQAQNAKAAMDPRYESSSSSDSTGKPSAYNVVNCDSRHRKFQTIENDRSSNEMLNHSYYISKFFPRDTEERATSISGKTKSKRKSTNQVPESSKAVEITNSAMSMARPAISPRLKTRMVSEMPTQTSGSSKSPKLTTRFVAETTTQTSFISSVDQVKHFQTGEASVCASSISPKPKFRTPKPMYRETSTESRSLQDQKSEEHPTSDSSQTTSSKPKKKLVGHASIQTPCITAASDMKYFASINVPLTGSQMSLNNISGVTDMTNASYKSKNSAPNRRHKAKQAHQHPCTPALAADTPYTSTVFGTHDLPSLTSSYSEMQSVEESALHMQRHETQHSDKHEICELVPGNTQIRSRKFLKEDQKPSAVSGNEQVQSLSDISSTSKAALGAFSTNTKKQPEKHETHTEIVRVSQEMQVDMPSDSNLNLNFNWPNTADEHLSYSAKTKGVSLSSEMDKATLICTTHTSRKKDFGTSTSVKIPKRNDTGSVETETLKPELCNQQCVSHRQKQTFDRGTERAAGGFDVNLLTSLLKSITVKNPASSDNQGSGYEQLQQSKFKKNLKMYPFDGRNSNATTKHSNRSTKFRTYNLSKPAAPFVSDFSNKRSLKQNSKSQKSRVQEEKIHESKAFRRPTKTGSPTRYRAIGYSHGQASSSASQHRRGTSQSEKSRTSKGKCKPELHELSPHKFAPKVSRRMRITLYLKPPLESECSQESALTSPEETRTLLKFYLDGSSSKTAQLNPFISHDHNGMRGANSISNSVTSSSHEDPRSVVFEVDSRKITDKLTIIMQPESSSPLSGVPPGIRAVLIEDGKRKTLEEILNEPPSGFRDLSMTHIPLQDVIQSVNVQKHPSSYTEPPSITTSASERHSSYNSQLGVSSYENRLIDKPQTNRELPVELMPNRTSADIADAASDDVFMKETTTRGQFGLITANERAELSNEKPPIWGKFTSAPLCKNKCAILTPVPRERLLKLDGCDEQLEQLGEGHDPHSTQQTNSFTECGMQGHAEHAKIQFPVYKEINSSSTTAGNNLLSSGAIVLQPEITEGNTVEKQVDTLVLLPHNEGIQGSSCVRNQDFYTAERTTEKQGHLLVLSSQDQVAQGSSCVKNQCIHATEQHRQRIEQPGCMLRHSEPIKIQSLLYKESNIGLPPNAQSSVTSSGNVVLQPEITTEKGNTIEKQADMLVQSPQHDMVQGINNRPVINLDVQAVEQETQKIEPLGVHSRTGYTDQKYKDTAILAKSAAPDDSTPVDEHYVSYLQQRFAEMLISDVSSSNTSGMSSHDTHTDTQQQSLPECPPLIEEESYDGSNQTIIAKIPQLVFSAASKLFEAESFYQRTDESRPSDVSANISDDIDRNIQRFEGVASVNSANNLNEISVSENLFGIDAHLVLSIPSVDNRLTTDQKTSSIISTTTYEQSCDQGNEAVTSDSSKSTNVHCKGQLDDELTRCKEKKEQTGADSNFQSICSLNCAENSYSLPNNEENISTKAILDSSPVSVFNTDEFQCHSSNPKMYFPHQSSSVLSEGVSVSTAITGDDSLTQTESRSSSQFSDRLTHYLSHLLAENDKLEKSVDGMNLNNERGMRLSHRLSKVDTDRSSYSELETECPVLMSNLTSAPQSIPTTSALSDLPVGQRKLGALSSVASHVQEKLKDRIKPSLIIQQPRVGSEDYRALVASLPRLTRPFKKNLTKLPNQEEINPNSNSETLSKILAILQHQKSKLESSSEAKDSDLGGLNEEHIYATFMPLLPIDSRSEQICNRSDRHLPRSTASSDTVNLIHRNLVANVNSLESRPSSIQQVCTSHLQQAEFPVSAVNEQSANRTSPTNTLPVTTNTDLYRTDSSESVRHQLERQIAILQQLFTPNARQNKELKR